ncbi:hypothetical protein C8Q76DRAFT_802513 [Earliella scabrosa]|nr:hypothetical protein C8Q76DRAFT_802513 [Earliella scabrosa]
MWELMVGLVRLNHQPPEVRARRYNSTSGVIQEGGHSNIEIAIAQHLDERGSYLLTRNRTAYCNTPLLAAISVNLQPAQRIRLGLERLPSPVHDVYLAHLTTPVRGPSLAPHRCDGERSQLRVILVNIFVCDPVRTPRRNRIYPLSGGLDAMNPFLSSLFVLGRPVVLEPDRASEQLDLWRGRGAERVEQMSMTTPPSMIASSSSIPEPRKTPRRDSGDVSFTRVRSLSTVLSAS